MQPSAPIQNDKKVKRMVALYNMVPNLFWSLLNLLPMFIFCYSRMPGKVIYVFSGVGLLAVFLPRSFFSYIQLSKTSAFYKKMGVHIIKKYAQNGDVITNLIRKKYPHYKVVTKNKKSIKSLLQQSYMFEKFHFILFLFFILTTIFAAINGYCLWVFILLITNLMYNVYPNLLQQYIRIRLKT